MYEWDRVQVPKFWTFITDNEVHYLYKKVLVEVDDHPSNGYFMMGIISKQSPLWQGTFLGIRCRKLEPAVDEDIFCALKKKHPDGRRWEPANLPDSVTYDLKARFDFSEQQIEEQRQQLLRRWDSICSRQIAAISDQHNLDRYENQNVGPFSEVLGNSLKRFFLGGGPTIR